MNSGNTERLDSCCKKTLLLQSQLKVTLFCWLPSLPTDLIRLHSKPGVHRQVPNPSRAGCGAAGREKTHNLTQSHFCTQNCFCFPRLLTLIRHFSPQCIITHLFTCNFLKFHTLPFFFASVEQFDWMGKWCLYFTSNYTECMKKRRSATRILDRMGGREFQLNCFMPVSEQDGQQLNKP